MAAMQSSDLFLVARSIGFCPLLSTASTSAPWSSSSSVNKSLLSTAAACNALCNRVRHYRTVICHAVAAGNKNKIKYNNNNNNNDDDDYYNY